MKYALIAIVAFVALGTYVLLTHEQNIPQTNTSLGTIEVVDEQEERERGLSGRGFIPDNYGMLFVFPEEGKYGFWMKDMKVSIDIIWLNREQEIVGIVHAASPDSYPDLYYPPEEIRYVLETRAGLSKERGWGNGTILTIPIP